MIRIITKIHKSNITSVISNNRGSETFVAKGGLEQGKRLKPTLFIVLYMRFLKYV